MSPPEAAGTGEQSPRPMPRGIDRIFRAMLFIVPLGVLGNIIFSLAVTDRALLASLRDFPRGYLALAVVLALVPWFTNSLRLLIWTDFLDHRIRFRDAFQITLAMDLGAAVSPTAVGGSLFKWGMLVQRGIRPGAAASITTLPTIEDGVFFAIAVPLAIYFTASWDLPVFRLVADRFEQDALLIVLVASSIALASWLAVRLILGGGFGSRTQKRSLRLVGRVRRKLRATWTDAREVFRLIATGGKWRFALSFLLTAIQWTCRYSVISALIAFLGAPVQPVLFWVLQWVVFSIMAMIPTPGAAGGAEAAFFFIYSAFLPERVIGLATAGWRFLTFYLLLGLAAILFFLLNIRQRD
jgi:glycosyltransferase 2 family protein